MAWRGKRHSSEKLMIHLTLQDKWDLEMLYFKDHPRSKVAPGNMTQMAHNVKTWTISSSLAMNFKKRKRKRIKGGKTNKQTNKQTNTTVRFVYLA